MWAEWHSEKSQERREQDAAVLVEAPRAKKAEKVGPFQI
jgi:hypothetical protein